MKNINPASMAQAIMQAQRIKKDLQKVRDKIKREKFSYNSDVLSLVINGEGEIISISIKSGFSNIEIEREVLKAHKDIESRIKQFSNTLMEPFAQYKDLM